MVAPRISVQLLTVAPASSAPFGKRAVDAFREQPPGASFGISTRRCWPHLPVRIEATSAATSLRLAAGAGTQQPMLIRTNRRFVGLLTVSVLMLLVAASCARLQLQYNRGVTSQVVGSNIHIRRAPSRDAEAYPTLAQNGDRVEILGQNGNWVHVVHNHVRTGYIFYYYVAATRPPSVAQHGASNKPKRRQRSKSRSRPQKAATRDCSVTGPVGSRTFTKGPWTIRERGERGTAGRNGQTFELWNGGDGQVLSIVGDVVSIWTSYEYKEGFKSVSEFRAISLRTHKRVSLASIISRPTFLAALATTTYGTCDPAGWKGSLCASHGEDAETRFAFEGRAAGGKVMVRFGLDNAVESNDGMLRGESVAIQMPTKWQRLVEEAERCRHLASQANTKQPDVQFDEQPR